MEQLLLVGYVLLSAAIVGLILLQQGRGADMGASFGAGASQTLFGSAGAGNVLSRSTAILAALFFVGSVGLAMIARHKAEEARTGGIPVPALIETRDNAAGDMPQAPAPQSAAAESSDIPVAAQSEVPAAEGDAQPATDAEEIPSGG